MEKNKLNLKILTSIFIVLFFIVFFNFSCYAYDIESTSQFDNFLNYIFTKNNYQDLLSQYDNCFSVCTSVNAYGTCDYQTFFFNDNNLDFISGNESISSYSFNSQVLSNFKINSLSLNYRNNPNPVITTYNRDNLKMYISFPKVSNNPIIDLEENIYVHKGNFTITCDNSSIIEPIPEFDFSFIINDHNFDFNFNGVTFSNGVNIDSDTIKQGHYICSLYQYEEMTYYNSDYKNYWVSGFLDYYPYSETNPEKYFYQSTGYNTLKINDSSGDNDYFYRFYFKGYSSDSSYQNFDNNLITNNVNDFNTYDNYTPFRSSTFFYSNRNIYWGVDSSLYGYNGITTNLFYEEDSTGVNVLNVSTTERISQDPEEDSTTYAIGNNVYNVPSSNANINNNSLYNYNGSSYGSISNYNSEENFTGTQIVAEDTSNWSTLDYVKHIPNAISNIPLGIMNMIIKFVIPNHDDLVDIYLGFQEFSQAHLGVLNAPISWIFNFLGSIREKYTDNYSYYNFTIPRF